MKKLLTILFISYSILYSNAQDIVATLDPINPLGWPFIWTLSYGEDSTLYAGDETGKLWQKKKDAAAWSQITSLVISGGTDIRGVKAFANDDIWVGTEGKGLYHFNGTSWQNYTIANTGLPTDTGYRRIIKDGNGDYWFSLRPGGLLKLSGTTWSHYDETNSPQTFASIGFMMLASDGSIWAVSSEKIFNIKNGVWKTHNIGELFPASFPNSVGYLYEDNDGSIWVCTTKGMYKFENNNWISKTDISGNVEVRTMVIDKRGSMWYVEYSKGLVRYNNGEKLTFIGTVDNKIPSQAWEILVNEKNEKLLVGNKGANMVIINDDAILSSSKDIKTSGFEIYPNPSSQHIILNEELLQNFISYTIYDLSGKQYKLGKLSSPIIDIADLKSGNYMLKLSNGKEEKVAHFVKI